MNDDDAQRRLEELFRRKLAEERAKEPSRDEAGVTRDEILDAVPEVMSEERAITLASIVLLPPNWYVLSRRASHEKGLLAIWFTDAFGWRRLRGG
jgi:hypothetical protein